MARFLVVEPAPRLAQESEASRRGQLGVTRVSRSQDVTRSYFLKLCISKSKSDYTVKNFKT